MGMNDIGNKRQNIVFLTISVVNVKAKGSVLIFAEWVSSLNDVYVHKEILSIDKKGKKTRVEMGRGMAT